MHKENTTLNVSPKNAVIISRKLFWKTDRDNAIEALEIPNKPLWLIWIIKMIRFYQQNISQKLWNRCVFDPSCSHYAEVAFREQWLIKWLILSLKRLHRCKPKNGWVDELK